MLGRCLRRSTHTPSVAARLAARRVPAERGLGLTDRAYAAGRTPGGASTPPCGTSPLAHNRMPPLKSGPASFKRLLGRTFSRIHRGALARANEPGHLLRVFVIACAKAFSNPGLLCKRRDQEKQPSYRSGNPTHHRIGEERVSEKRCCISDILRISRAAIGPCRHQLALKA